MGKGGDQSSGEHGAGGGASKSKEQQSSQSSESAIRKVEVLKVLHDGFLVQSLDDKKIRKHVHYKQIGHEEVKNRNASKGENKKSLEKVATEMNNQGWIKEVPWENFTLIGDHSNLKAGFNSTTIWSMKYVDQRNKTDLDPENTKLELDQSQYLSSQFRKCRKGDIVYDLLECENCKDKGHLKRQCPKKTTDSGAKGHLEGECDEKTIDLQSRDAFPDLTGNSKWTAVRGKRISRSKRQ